MKFAFAFAKLDRYAFLCQHAGDSILAYENVFERCLDLNVQY